MSSPRVSPPAGAGDDPVNGSPLARQPEALQAFNTLYGVLWSKGVLDHKAKEMARLRNARRVNCTYCKSVRFEGAQREGLDEGTVDKIQDGHEDSDLSPRDKLVLCYTDAMLERPGEPDEKLRQAMLDEFSDEEIVELTVAISLFTGFSRIAVTMGGMPESLPLTTVPTPEPG